MRRQRSNRGVSLLGVVIAVVLLTVLIVPLVGLVGGGARRTAMTEDRFRATRIALRLLDYFADNPVLAPGFRVPDGQLPPNLVVDSLLMNDPAYLLPLSTLSLEERQALIDDAVEIRFRFFDRIILDGDVPEPGIGLLEATVTWTAQGIERNFVARQMIKTE